MVRVVACPRCAGRPRFMNVADPAIGDGAVGPAAPYWAARSVGHDVSMRRWVGRLMAVSGLALFLLPVGPAGGPQYGCGPAATALLRLSEPDDPDRFVPNHPGADFGVSAAVSCQGAAFDRVKVGGPLLAAGLATLQWNRRRPKPQVPAVTVLAFPPSAP